MGEESRGWLSASATLQEVNTKGPLLPKPDPSLWFNAVHLSSKVQGSHFPPCLELRTHALELKTSVVVQLLSAVQLFATLQTAAHQAPLSLTTSQSLLKLMLIELIGHPAISSSVIPFSYFQSSPSSKSFPVSQLFASVGQSIGASASVLPMNIQG